MKNIIKTVIVMLTSISLFSSANAGELKVNGTAKATYNILSGQNRGKGLGITNELNFTAAGELDNGYTWSYSMELDPGAANAAGTAQGTTGENQDAQNDDTKLTLTTPYGTVGVFISEGGLDVEDAASQSVYSRPTDVGDPSSGSGDNFTIDSYNNVQYHTPADLLPFGLSVKGAYAPDTTTYGSGNAKGETKTDTAAANNTVTLRGATEVQVKANALPMLDGLTIGASYFSFDTACVSTTDCAQEPESGAYFASYASGPFSVGYSKAHKAMGMQESDLADETIVESYDQTNMSIAYAATDDLSISYEQEKDKRDMMHNTPADVEQESTSIQVAYTMGGMTLALVHGNYDNVGFATGAERDQTLFAVTMAF